MNTKVIQIGEVLKNALSPMTNVEIAKEMGVSRQTVFNHMPEAIKHKLAIDTGMRDGKAVLYASPNYKNVAHYTVPWTDNKPVILKEILTEWSTKKPPVAAVPLFRIITSLYTHALVYVDDTFDEKPVSEKILELKELRAKLKSTINVYETLLGVARALYNDDALTHPRDLVTSLIIKDEDTTPQEIRAILDRQKNKE